MNHENTNKPKYDFLAFDPYEKTDTHKDDYMGDTYYLDKLMHDRLNSNTEDEKIGKLYNHYHRVTIYVVSISFFLLVIAGLFDIVFFAKIIRYIVIIAFAYVGVIAAYISFKRAINSFLSAPDLSLEEDCINNRYISPFLRINGIPSFRYLGRSFCINDRSTDKHQPSEPTSDTIVFIFFEFVYICFMLFLDSYFSSNQSQSTDVALFNLIFSVIWGSEGIFVFVYLLLCPLYERRHCTKKITAICVDKEKVEKTTRGAPDYQPFYYIKYNDKGYILFSNAHTVSSDIDVGTIEKSFYINPDNPFEFCVKNTVLFIIVYICITFGLIGSSIFMLLSM